MKEKKNRQKFEHNPPRPSQDHSVPAHLAVAMELLSAVEELMETQGVVTNDRDTLTKVCQLGNACNYMYLVYLNITWSCGLFMSDRLQRMHLVLISYGFVRLCYNSNFVINLKEC